MWREGDVDWNPVTTLAYPAICSVAGLVAGMFGVGGGIVKISFSYKTHMPIELRMHDDFPPDVCLTLQEIKSAHNNACQLRVLISEEYSTGSFCCFWHSLIWCY